MFSFCSVSRGLHPQCKLDLESAAPAGESKPRLSFPFPPQPRDLYARRAAAGCGARGCAVILPKVKLPPFLLDRSSVALPSPPREEAAERRRPGGRDARRETRCWESFVGCKAQKWKVALWERISVGAWTPRAVGGNGSRTRSGQRAEQLCL